MVVPGSSGGSKQRIEQVAGEILARRGYNGMGLKALSEAAALPYGSIYHHFPGGKEQIAAAAVASVGEVVVGLLVAVFADLPPEEAVRAMFDYSSDRLRASDWADGCPVGSTALDGADEAIVRAACDLVFDDLVGAVRQGLAKAGIADATAHDLALTVMAAYEGATLLAKVQRSDEPLRRSGEVMAGLVSGAVAAATG